MSLSSLWGRGGALHDEEDDGGHDVHPILGEEGSVVRLLPFGPLRRLALHLLDERQRIRSRTLRPG